MCVCQLNSNYEMIFIYLVFKYDFYIKEDREQIELIIPVDTKFRPHLLK